MISAVPMQNALLMGGYGVGKQWAEATTTTTSADATTTKTSSNLLLACVFVGGLTGGVLQSFLMSPVELIKVNQQVNATKTARIALSEVWNGLLLAGRGGGSRNSSKSWRGLNATLWRDGIPHGIWFVSYEWCKTTLTRQYFTTASVVMDEERSSLSSPASSLESASAWLQVAAPLASGAFAATVAWAVGYPFDIIKTRIQAAPESQGIYETALQLIKEANGNLLQGLYRGFTLKLVRAVPASMVGFLTYETVAGTIRGGTGTM